MEDKIYDIIPTILAEMQDDDENESDKFLTYYIGCNTVERSAVNETLMYLCGWSFETILAKCGIAVDENGEPQITTESNTIECDNCNKINASTVIECEDCHRRLA